YKVANEIRNVFRNIKNSLIEDRNMLDASNYHRVELYCKELERKYRRKEKAKKSGVRDVVDRIHLMLYRLTSDHHTDLLLILNNVVILIALFGVANFTLPRLNQFDTLQFEFLTCCISLLEFLNCIAFVGISIFILLHRKLTLKKSYRICLKTIKNNFVIILPYIAFMLYVLCNYSTSSVCLLCIAFSVPLLYFMVYMLAKRFHIKIAKKITLTLAYLMFGFMFIIRNCMLCIAYIVAFIMLFCSPSSILPILGKLIENKTSQSCHCNDFDIFGFCCTTESVASETLNLIYMLLLFLLLFSLQKTARKNTIIPN
ncbi:MAG: hypothetical protein K2N69_04150, partial [Helicobacter sp.]|nr:hypothetical protein [Helicobacter sp.]